MWLKWCKLTHSQAILKKLCVWNYRLGVFRPRRDGGDFFFKLEVCFNKNFNKQRKYPGIYFFFIDRTLKKIF